MGQHIEDPLTGDTARVNPENRLTTEAVTEDEGLHQAKKGQAYNINTGQVDFTNSTATPILYLENQEDYPMIIEAMALGIDDLGTHTGTPLITMIRNPTSVDFSTAVDMKQNRDFSSSASLKSTTLAYKGAVGDTVTGGNDIAIFTQQEAGRLFAAINFKLGVGDSICITLDAQVTGGTCKAYCALVVYLDDAT